MVFGEEFQLSVDDLVVRLGFYTEKTFNNHHFMQSLTDVPDSPGQKASLEIVSKMDLLCLYNIVNRVPIHLSVVMAIMFHKHTKKDLATLYIGPFVTKQLKSLGFEDKFKELQPIVDIITQSERYLLNLKIPSSVPEAMHKQEVPALPPTQPIYVPDSWVQMRAFQKQLIDGLRTDMNARFDYLNSRFEGFQSTVL
nr:uncharacterized protein LOC110914485 [Ipomoea batatas]